MKFILSLWQRHFFRRITILYIEPPYRKRAPHQWLLNGRYRYPSILGELRKRANTLIAMPKLPPANDPLRKNLEKKHKVKFVEIPDGDAESISKSLEKYEIDIVSNLWGRPINQLNKLQRIASNLHSDFVLRIGGDDISTKMELARKNGVNFVGTEKHKYLQNMEKKILLKANRIIVMSRQEERRIKTIVGKDNKNIFVCPRGVDRNAFKRRSDFTIKTPTKILFVGRESPEKGSDIFDDLADTCLARNRQFEFVYLGNFEPQMKPNRKYMGFISPENLPRHYQDADIFINCSRSEGLPQTVMEAMSIGIPCILPEKLFSLDFPEGSGVLLSNNTTSDLLEKIDNLIGNQEKYTKLCQLGIEFSQNNFNKTQNNYNYLDALLNKNTHNL